MFKRVIMRVGEIFILCKLSPNGTCRNYCTNKAVTGVVTQTLDLHYWKPASYKYHLEMHDRHRR